MAFTRDVRQNFMGALNRPLGGAAHKPVLSRQVGLSAVVTGRGCYVPSLKIAFMAIRATGTFLRFDTVNNVELAPLAVAGAISLHSAVFNPSDGFIYTADNGNTIRQVNPATGANTAFTPVPDAILSDAVYSPVGNFVWFVGNVGTTVVRIDTAGTMVNAANFAPRGTSSLTWCDNVSKVGVGLNNGCGTIVPASQFAVQANDAQGSTAISYGAVSGKCLRSSFGVLTSFNPASLAFAALPIGVPGGQLASLSYSSIHGAHILVDVTGGIAYFISDGGGAGLFGSLISSFATIGANAFTATQDSFAINSGSAIYLPTTNVPKMNIFA